MKIMEQNNILKIYIVEDAPERIEWFKKTFTDCELSIIDDVGKACEDLSSNRYDLIFLDRDLGHTKETGEDVAWHMYNNKLAEDSLIVVHTMNTRGQRVIMRYLDKYHDNSHLIPFNELMKMKREDFKFADK